MSTPELELIRELSAHMRYMHEALAEHHQLDELEDYHWHRQAVRLQALAEALLSSE